MTDNYDDLRELAEKAKGPWPASGLGGLAPFIRASNAYIAAANPQRILALLAERDRLDEAVTSLGATVLLRSSEKRAAEIRAESAEAERDELANVLGQWLAIAEAAEAEVARLRAVVERVEKLADAWEPTHGNCGCAWCDLYDDLRAALAPEATR